MARAVGDVANVSSHDWTLNCWFSICHHWNVTEQLITCHECDLLIRFSCTLVKHHPTRGDRHTTLRQRDEATLLWVVQCCVSTSLLIVLPVGLGQCYTELGSTTHGYDVSSLMSIRPISSIGTLPPAVSSVIGPSHCRSVVQSSFVSRTSNVDLHTSSRDSPGIVIYRLLRSCSFCLV